MKDRVDEEPLPEVWPPKLVWPPALYTLNSLIAAKRAKFQRLAQQESQQGENTGIPHLQWSQFTAADRKKEMKKVEGKESQIVARKNRLKNKPVELQKGCFVWVKTVDPEDNEKFIYDLGEVDEPFIPDDWGTTKEQQWDAKVKVTWLYRNGKKDDYNCNYGYKKYTDKRGPRKGKLAGDVVVRSSIEVENLEVVPVRGSRGRCSKAGTFQLTPDSKSKIEGTGLGFVIREKKTAKNSTSAFAPPFAG